MKRQFVLLIPVLGVALAVALGSGCSDKGGPVAPNDPQMADSGAVSTLSAVISPSEHDGILVGQTVIVTCSSSSTNNAELPISWSANCGTFNRTDSCAVEWLAPDTGASAEIIATVSDGHQQAGDTLRISVFPSGTWERSYNLGSYEDGQDILCAADGGYVVLVSHGSVHLVKIGDDGSQIWHRFYALSGSHWGRSVTDLPDGGYAIVGYRRIIDGTNYEFDVFLLRVDAAGTFMWVKYFGGSGPDDGYDVTSTPEGGMLIVGSTGSFGEPDEVVYVICTDAEGNLQWQKTYPGTRGTCVTGTSKGEYAITGEMGAWCSGSSDVFLLMIDTDGNVIAQPTYGDSDGELSFSVVEIPGRGFAIAGQAYTASTGGTDGFLLLTDQAGTLTQWTDFGGEGDDFIRDVVVTPQGGFAVAGYTSSFGEGGHDMYLTSFDGEGVLQWGRTFGGSDLEEGQALVCTDDNGFMVVGRTMSFSWDLCDLYVVKADKHGRVWEPAED